jgi:hypothetical protein
VEMGGGPGIDEELPSVGTDTFLVASTFLVVSAMAMSRADGLLPFAKYSLMLGTPDSEATPSTSMLEGDG